MFLEHEPHTLPRAGAVDSQSVSASQQETLSGVMARLSERVGQRRVLVKPCFQDFDRSATHPPPIHVIIHLQTGAHIHVHYHLIK